MIIFYDFGSKLKIDGDMGMSYCPNCHHQAPQHVARLVDYLSIMFIPVFKKTGLRFKYCSNCGIVETYDNATYKQLKEQYPKAHK